MPPVLSLNLEAPPTPEEEGVGRAPEVSPMKLLALLDKAKAFPLLKAQQPESVADVGFTTYDGKPLVSDFNDYEIQIEQAFRFNAEDTLVFRVAITNKVDAPLIYQPDSFALRAGNRLYPQSISDADGTVPPKGRSIVYFAVTGTPDGGRNESVLEEPVHRAGELAFHRRRPLSLSPMLPACIPFVHRKASHETARLSQFLQNQKRQAGCLRRAVRRRVDHLQRHPQTPHGCRRRHRRYASGHQQCWRQTPGGAVRRAAHAAFPSAAAQTGTGFIITRDNGNSVRFHQRIAATVAGGSAAPAESLTPISLFADSTAGVPQPKKLSAVYAPFGRLIPCETVITVDSASIQTPIIGLVTENVYFGGKLIIPAGTEVHGMAQTDRQRERIAGNTSWTFVWQNGEEMQIKAIALDREFDNSTNQSGWAITDGSAGLRGAAHQVRQPGRHQTFCRHVPFRRGQRPDGKAADRFWPHQQSHAQQRALCRRAGGAANLRTTNPRFDPEERVLRPRAQRHAVLSLRPANY